MIKLTIKQFKKRFIRGLVEPDLFKLPLKDVKDTTPILLYVNIYTYNRYNVDTGEFSSLYNINSKTEIIIIDTKDNAIIYNGKQNSNAIYRFSVQKNHTYKIKVLSSQVSYIDEVWHEIKPTKDQTFDIVLTPYPIYYVKTSLIPDQNIQFEIMNNKNEYRSFFDSASAKRDICRYEYYENNRLIYSEMENNKYFSTVSGTISNIKSGFDINSYVVNKDGLSSGLTELVYDFTILDGQTPKYQCYLKIIPSNQKYYVSSMTSSIYIDYDTNCRLYFYTQDDLVGNSNIQVYKAEYIITDFITGDIINQTGYVREMLDKDLITCGYTPMNFFSNYEQWEDANDYLEKYVEYHNSEINNYKRKVFTYYTNDFLHIDYAYSQEQYQTIYSKLASDPTVTDLSIETEERPFAESLINTEWYSKGQESKSTNYLLSSIIIKGYTMSISNNTRLVYDGENLYYFSSPSWASYCSDYNEY